MAKHTKKTSRRTPPKAVTRGGSKAAPIKSKSATKAQAKSVVKAKRAKAKPTPLRGKRLRVTKKATAVLQKSIIETSPLIWSTDDVGPTFDQIQVAAYHRWLQHGGTESQNWSSAEDELRRSTE
ncbi:MAG: DUF2934 domain-containing protein [Phycisphaerales bacterium]|nr:DUF2934 domain-containing protein [Phycisphaerales bacterium]